MDEIVKLVAYIPEIAIGVIVILFTLEVLKRVGVMQDKFLAALDKRDADFEARNSVVVQTLNALCSATQEHDTYVRTRLEDLRSAITPQSRHNGDDERRGGLR